MKTTNLLGSRGRLPMLPVAAALLGMGGLVAWFRLAAAPTADGIAVHSNNATTPVAKAYTASTNTFAAGATMPTGAAQTWVVDRAAPTRNEHIAGYVTTGGVLYVVRWNGTAWSAEWNVTVGGNGVDGRRFDIVYETTTGDCLVVYSNNTTGTNELRYRLWNGTSWTAATNLDSARLTGTPTSIKLAARPTTGSDEIAATIADSNSLLTTLIWSGSAWGNEPSGAHGTLAGTAGQNDLWDQAYESASGDLLVIFTTSTPQQNHRTYSAGSWGTTTSWGTGRSAPLQMVASPNPDPASNQILCLFTSGGTANVYARVWSGTAMGTTNTVGTNGATPAINQRSIGAGWAKSGTSTAAIAFWGSTNGNVIDYNYTTNGGTSWAGATTYNITIGNRRWFDAAEDPKTTDTLMLLVSDSAGDLFARRITWNGTAFSWTTPTNGTLTTTLASTTTQNFMFAYDRLIATNGTTAGTATATASGCTSIAVSAPYTGDSNANNSLAYRYRTPTGTGGWSTSTNVAHAASPYSFTIPGLTFGATYDVEVTYVDADGISGTNPQTITNITAGANCTGAGTVTAAQTAGATPSIAVSAPYTGDANGNNAASYRYRTPSGTGAWSGTTNLLHAASPYTATISGLTCGATYDVEFTFADADGIGSGTAVQTVSGIALGNCTSIGTVTASGGACGSISITAPYSQDANASNSLSYRYRTPTGTGAWTSSTPVAHSASPYSVSVTSLSAGTYDVEVTFVDSDGLTGTNPQTVTNLTVSSNCTTAGTATAAATSCTQITVSAPFTGDSNNNGSVKVEWNASNTWPGTTACASITGTSPRTCPVSGLTNNTPYYFRVTFTDADGVNGTNPQVIGPVNTADCRVTPGAASASPASCNQVLVSIPFTGDFNANSSVSVLRGTAGTGGPFPTTVCTGLTGTSPRTCTDNTASASTAYYYQVTFTDTDGIVGGASQVASATTPACTVNNTTAGTLAAAASSCNSVTVTATFTGDGNSNGSTLIEYNTANTWPGTSACAAASGPSPRQCAVTGLTANTTYYFRATFSDADGVSGTNPTAVVSVTTPTPCAADTIAPTLTVLAPSRNAVLTAADTVKVQIYDASGLRGTNPVEWQVDSTNSSTFAVTGVLVNSSYSCGANCAVYEIPLPAQTAGGHYIAIRATDTAGNGAVLTWAFQFKSGGSGNLLRRSHGSELCIDCHSLQTHNSQYTSTKYGNWSFDCLGCHTPHKTANIYLLRPSLDTPASGTKAIDFRNRTGVAANSYATPATSPNPPNPPGVCEACHTKTKNGDNTARARNNAWTDWSKHYTGRCTGCHVHSKGFLAGESDGGVDCAGCHQTIWEGMNGTTAKASKHGIGNVTGANDSFNDSGLTWGNPLSGNAAGNRSCVNMCHNDHPHTLTSPATATHQNNVYLDSTDVTSRAASSRTNANKMSTDFDAAQANGGMCLSCHRNPVDAAHPAVDKTNYSTSAHNYSNWASYGAWQYTQHDGSLFSRNCTKCHADRNDTRPGDAVTPFGAVHFSDYDMLLAGSRRPNGAPATFVCYNCHGNGTTGTNLSSKDIATAIGRARNHPANTDNVHDSVTEFANASFGNTLGVTGRHSNCQDCHDSHEAKQGSRQYSIGTATFSGTTVTGTGTNWTSYYVGARIKPWDTSTTWYTISAVNSATSITLSASAAGATSVNYIIVKSLDNLAGPGLSGSWGAQLSTNPAFWTDTAAGNFTKKTMVTGTDIEATLCFKCHTKYYWGAGTPPTAPSGGTETDVAKEFNPGNTGNFAGTWASGETAGGFHPVVATAGSNLGAIKLANLVTTNLPWSTTARNLMACTDCHESDTKTDPSGPHGSAANYVLRGPNTTWNGTVTLGSSIPAGTFCLNCHQNTFTNSRFPDHSRSNHYVACWNCHAAVPHGGPRPGMLIAPAGAAAGVGNTITTWDTAAPYWGLASSTNKLYLVSYPANNTTSWAQGNCGCNGTGH